MAIIANSGYNPERPLTARALVLDFLSNRAPREISARAVLAAGAAFGFSAQNLRMALMRLVDQGAAVNSSRGRYRLGAPGETMRLEVRKWKRVADLVRPWPGGWVGVYGAEIARSDRAAIRRHEQALRLRGFREFSSGLWIRPANLRDSVAELRAHLAALGLHRDAIVVGLSDFDDAASARAVQSVGHRRNRTLIRCVAERPRRKPVKSRATAAYGRRRQKPCCSAARLSGTSISIRCCPKS